jgi:hypothetical protein
VYKRQHLGRRPRGLLNPHIFNLDLEIHND